MRRQQRVSGGCGECLISAGFGRSFAKLLVHKKLADDAQIQRNGDDFDASQLAAWGNDDERESSNILAFCKKFLDDHESALALRREAMESTLTRNPTWAGAMVQMDAHCDFSDFVPNVCLATELGATPWIFSHQRSVWRYGPSTFPLVGCSCFVMALDLDVVVVVFPAIALVREGIALSDVKAFLETPAGSEWFGKHGVLLTLQKGGLCFIPCGMIPLVVALPPTDNAGDESFAHVLHFPVFGKDLRKAVPEQGWTAIVNYNDTYFSRFSESPMWQSREETWRKFLE